MPTLSNLPTTTPINTRQHMNRSLTPGRPLLANSSSPPIGALSATSLATWSLPSTRFGFECPATDEMATRAESAREVKSMLDGEGDELSECVVVSNVFE